MKPYFKYTISGIEYVSINGNDLYFSIEHDFIEKIDFTLDDNSKNITSITFYLKENTHIDETMKEKLNSIIITYLFSIIAELKPIINNFSYVLSEIYNPSDSMHSASIDLNVSVHIAPPIFLYNIGKYKELFISTNSTEAKTHYYNTALSIIKINDISIRFLAQYQLLLSLVNQKNKKLYQKSITEYIKKNYNPYFLDNKINITIQKKQYSHKREKVDELTYYRNVLAHSNLEQIEQSKELITKINELSIKINHIIYHCIDSLD